MKYLIVIPARYNSTRFPGKPLINIDGKSMIYRVWEKCSKVTSPQNIIIATDDDRIYSHCIENSMNPLMTSTNCLTGTDRLCEVSKILNADFYINVQGDEPFIQSSDISLVINEAKKDPKTVINAMCEIKLEEEYYSTNIPKVVTSKDNILLYMSRSPIPGNKKNIFSKAMKQVCIYSFSKYSLDQFSSLQDKTNLEKTEDIEILRLLELGFRIKMVKVSNSSIAIDTPEDLIKAKKILNEENI